VEVTEVTRGGTPVRSGRFMAVGWWPSWSTLRPRRQPSRRRPVAGSAGRTQPAGSDAGSTGAIAPQALPSAVSIRYSMSLRPTTQPTMPASSRTRMTDTSSAPVAIAYVTVSTAPMPTQTA